MRGLKKAAETVKPIPAFYCCYLLRSTIRKQSLYVGSTPHPPRRLGQHNGLSKGGAVRTSKSTLRPWEMACIVTGFPSKIAALQFEWAWQNTHLTRHISASERITQTHTVVRISPRTGKTRRRPARPRVSLTDKISNLHILLRVKSFERWPLQVKFFSEDAHRVWKKWDNLSAEKIRKSIRIDLEHVAPPSVESTLAAAVAAEIAEDGGDVGTPNLPRELAKGIYALELGYGPLKPRIEKAMMLLETSKPPLCCICMRRVEQETLALVCPADRCYAVSHLNCLSHEFLRHENNENAVVPIKGHCPRCQIETDWSTLVTDLSLRLRGQAEIDKMFKKGRRKKAEVTSKGKSKGKGIAGGSGDVGTEQTATLLNESDASEVEDETLPDDWVYYEEEQDDQYASAQGRGSEPMTGHSRHVDFIDLNSDEE